MHIVLKLNSCKLEYLIQKLYIAVLKFWRHQKGILKLQLYPIKNYNISIKKSFVKQHQLCPNLCPLQPPLHQRLETKLDYGQQIGCIKSKIHLQKIMQSRLEDKASATLSFLYSITPLCFTTHFPRSRIVAYVLCSRIYYFKIDNSKPTIHTLHLLEEVF